MQLGDYHSFTESVIAFGGDGTIRPIEGGDNIIRNMVEIS